MRRCTCLKSSRRTLPSTASGHGSTGGRLSSDERIGGRSSLASAPLLFTSSAIVPSSISQALVFGLLLSAFQFLLFKIWDGLGRLGTPFGTAQNMQESQCLCGLGRWDGFQRGYAYPPSGYRRFAARIETGWSNPRQCEIQKLLLWDGLGRLGTLELQEPLSRLTVFHGSREPTEGYPRLSEK